jgi:hypothetical protein
VYTLGEFHKNRNNSTVFEELEVSMVDLSVANIRLELEVSIVDLTVANISFTGSASRRQ